MATQQHSDESERQGTNKALKRRGLLAGAAALVAGIAAKQTAQPVAAATNMQYADTAAIATNTARGETQLVAGSGSNPGVMLLVDATAATGSNTIAIQTSSGGNGIGVFASTQAGTGVTGQTTAPTGSAQAGVLGSANSSGTFGVHGVSTSGIGVYGNSTSGLNGVRGDAGTAPGAAGVLGIANNTNAVAFAGVAQVPAVWAGYFTGITVVNGNFAVTGTKNAAVKDAAGNYRLMHCVEAPEAWFEDFGEGKLTNGKAAVTFDPEFAALVHIDTYMVFLTERGESSGIYVSAQSATGFSVQERNKGASGSAFYWRVVAKRADVSGERLAKFTLPHVTISELGQSKPPQLPNKP